MVGVDQEDVSYDIGDSYPGMLASFSRLSGCPLAARPAAVPAEAH